METAASLVSRYEDPGSLHRAGAFGQATDAVDSLDEAFAKRKGRARMSRGDSSLSRHRPDTGA